MLKLLKNAVITALALVLVAPVIFNLPTEVRYGVSVILAIACLFDHLEENKKEADRVEGKTTYIKERK